MATNAKRPYEPAPAREDPLIDRMRQAADAHYMIGLGYTVREVAAHLGLSLGTAWRRNWWAVAMLVGPQTGPLPTMRGVRPRPGRWVPSSPHFGRDDRELYRLEPRPAVRCVAHRKSDGRPCGSFAVHGGVVCTKHGGSAPQVRRAADARHSRAN